MARHDLNGPEAMTSAVSPAAQAGRIAVVEAPGLATPLPMLLDRLAPLAAVAAWLATDHRPDVAATLVAVIRTDTRVELEPEDVSAVLADARGEGLDAETAFERLILQGEWLSMDRLARIRPR